MRRSVRILPNVPAVTRDRRIARATCEDARELTDRYQEAYRIWLQLGLRFFALESERRRRYLPHAPEFIRRAYRRRKAGHGVGLLVMGAIIGALGV